MITCAFTGFASGLPLFVLVQLVQAWLRDEGVGLTEIGLFALAQVPYTWKFIWSPLAERYPLPFLGRRRGWMLVTQLALVLGFAGFGYVDPVLNIEVVFVLALLVGFFSASQDIVIDAYRRELLPTEEELALGNSIHVQVYRIAGFVPGSLGLILADVLPWSVVYWTMAGFMAIGVATTLVVREAVLEPEIPPSLKAAVVEPFREYFGRRGWGYGLAVLLFLFAYKFGDSMATALSTTFYLDLGFSKTEIGVVAKNAGFWPALIGGLLGGLLIVKIGINRGLWVFGVVQLITILGFAYLAQVGNDLVVLAVVISAEYLGVGLGTAAFVAFIARETSPALAATQFALFSAVTALPRTLTAAATGWLVEVVGWVEFFYLCTVAAVPGMLLLVWVAPFTAPSDVPEPRESR
ncbi:MAG: MFS transporter [Pseudomonadales bacterium]|nr:AmpG family muropeptide MFS transporter [Pseudomonadales bacterium]NIX08960.1 MFS transporter [Pseudomonadales bacterium]